MGLATVFHLKLGVAKPRSLACLGPHSWVLPTNFANFSIKTI